MKDRIGKAILVASLTMCLKFMCACTYNVSMIHSEGVSKDQIEDTATNTPNISPDVSVPLVPKLALGITK